MVKNLSRKIKELQARLEKTRQDLEDLESYVYDLTSFLPVAFCYLSGVGKIVDLNLAFKELTGFSLMEIHGRKIEDFFIERTKINWFLKEASQKKKIIKNKECTLVTKEKKEIPVTVSISARYDKKNTLIGYFLGMVDIGKLKELQKNLEKKVRKRTIELQERIEELEKFRKLTERRELKMIELKKKIKELEEKLKPPIFQKEKFKI